METEHWALLISTIALFVSIGLPIWQLKESTKRTIASKRTLMLQTVLSTRSVNYSSLHELRLLLSKYHPMMGEQQKKELEKLVLKLSAQDKELDEVHQHYSNYDDGAKLIDIEESQAVVDLALSEAKDTAKIIETGFKSYENT